MVDVQTEITETVITAEKFIARIELKGNAGTVEIDPDDITDMEVYQAIFVAGLEAFINKANGAAKAITGVTKLEGKALEERQATIREAAEKTVTQLKNGIIPSARAKKAKVSGAVNTEAMRLARALAKDAVRASGQRIGAYSAKDYTAAAKKILEGNPHLIQLAEKNIAARADEAKGTKALDLMGLFGEKSTDPANLAKPKVPPKRKGTGDKPQLSAKQAGMVASKQKPAAAHTQH